MPVFKLTKEQVEELALDLPDILDILERRYFVCKMLDLDLYAEDFRLRRDEIRRLQKMFAKAL